MQKIVAIFIAIIAIISIRDIVAFYKKPTPMPTPEQFQAQLAEQNRQARVMSKLQAVEVGDFAVTTDGKALIICWIDRDHNKMVLVALGEDCKPTSHSAPVAFHARHVNHVVKLYSNDAAVANVARRFADPRFPLR